jgi:hypothetical protein
VPDPDLGELKVAEPPLFHQAAPDVAVDLFMECSPPSESKIVDGTEHRPDVASTAPSLVGAWSGTYDDRRGLQNDGLVSLSITEKSADGNFEGLGVDGVGMFTIAGTIVGSKVNFTKTYTAPTFTWRYIGTLNTDMTEMHGRWGPSEMEDEEVAPVPVVEDGGALNHEGGLIDRDSVGDEKLPEQTPPCDIEITVEGPNGTSGEGQGEKTVEDTDGISEAGYSVSTIRTDATEVLVPGGNFTLVHRPVDYFLYRPSDADFQESRPKALWQMVRNAARYWYRSRHLTWDTLRQRRDQRNEFIELLSRRNVAGRLYDDEAAEWANITQQNHPNDLLLWRTIMCFKQSRMVHHLYVDLIPYLRSPRGRANAGFRVSCDNCGNTITDTRLVCSDCTEGGWSNSIDLCANCWSSDCSRESDHKRHVSTHTLIQFRRLVSRMEHYDCFEYAKQSIKASIAKQSEGSELSCAICKTAIPEKPYWCCLGCDGTFSISVDLL